MSKAPNASGLNGISQPPAIAASTRPSRRSPSASPSATAPEAHELAVDRIGPRTPRAIPRLAGAAPPNTARARLGATARCRAPGSARAAPRRRRSRPARSRGRSRSAPEPPPRRRPGARPASSSASRPATRPNWLNRSSWRAVLGGIQASGSKSSTWAATCERNGLGSKRSIRLTGERPARRPGAERVASGPDRGDDPDPGDPDPPTLAHVGGFVGAGGSDWPGPEGVPNGVSAGASASASASALNVASVRPAIGRVNTRSTNIAKPGRRGPEVVLDRDAGAGRRSARSAR